MSKESEKDFFSGEVDPNRQVSEEFIEALHQAGAKQSLIRAIRSENEKKRHRAKK